MTKPVSTSLQSRSNTKIQSLDQIALQPTPIDMGRYEVLIAQLASLLYEHYTQSELPSEPIVINADESLATQSGNSNKPRSPHDG